MTDPPLSLVAGAVGSLPAPTSVAGFRSVIGDPDRWAEGGGIVRRIPIILIAFLIGVVEELMLLMIGGFDLRIGGDGPASLVLFITHLPAMYLCGALPLKLQTDLAVIIAMTCLLSIAVFMMISLLRMQRSGSRPKAQQVRLN